MIRNLLVMVHCLIARFIWWLIRPEASKALALRDAMDEYLERRFRIQINALGKRVSAHDAVMENIRAAGDGGHRGRNWMLMCFRRGNQDIVHVYDFGNSNMGGLIEMAKGFERAGISVTLDVPHGARQPR